MTARYGVPGSYKPTAATTGIPAGVTLVPSSGSRTITTAGTVLDGLDISGTVSVQAADVVIRNCRIRGTNASGSNTACIMATNAGCVRLLVEDCEIVPDFPSIWVNGINGSNFTIQRCNIHESVDGIGVYNTNAPGAPLNVNILANYIHDLTYFTPDPNHNDNQTHNDCIQIQGGTGATIVGNNIYSYYSTTAGSTPRPTAQALSCVLFNNNVGNTGQHYIADNWLYGGNIPVNCGGAPGMFLGKIVRNRFGNDSSTATQSITMDSTQTANTGAGTSDQNTYPDGSAITVRRGGGSEPTIARWTNNAEGVATGTAVTAANSATSGSAFSSISKSGTGVFSYSSATAAEGTSSFLVTGASGDTALGIYTLAAADTNVTVRMAVCASALPSAVADVLQVRQAGGNIVKAQLRTDGALQVQDAASAFVAATPALTLGSWYALELRVQVGTTTTNGQIEAHVYPVTDPSALLIDVNSAAANTGTTAVTNVRFGKMTTTGTLAMNVDLLAAETNDPARYGIYTAPATVTMTTVGAQGDLRWQVRQVAADTADLRWPVTATTAVRHRTAFGTLQTYRSQVAAEAAQGTTVAMLELRWSDCETSPGVFVPSAMDNARADLAAFLAQGMRVSLGLGLHYAPAWLEGAVGVAAARFKDQTGATSITYDFVWSAAVRARAQSYLAWVATQLDLSAFTSVRVTSGGRSEILYPETSGAYSWWAYGAAPQLGTGLAAGQTVTPYPGWQAGTGDVSIGTAGVQTWLDWYLRSLANAAQWQADTMRALGVSSAAVIEWLCPGAGVRPSQVGALVAAGLPAGHLLGVGAAWEAIARYVPDRPRTALYCTSVGDGSGSDNFTLPGDRAVAVTDSQVTSWSATRWIARVAAEYGLRFRGENSGVDAVAAGHYADTGPAGLMTAAVRQMLAASADVSYWAHSGRLSDGTIPAGQVEYGKRIASEGGAVTTLAGFNFTGSTLAATAVDVGVTATAITLGPGISTDVAVGVKSGVGYASEPTLNIAPGAAGTSTTYRSTDYVEFTVTPVTGRVQTLTSLAFNATKGGAANPRGYVVKSSVDGFTAELAKADLTTQRTSWTAVTVPLSGAGFTNAGAITFRVYCYAPAISNTVDLDDIVLTGSTVAATTTVGAQSDLRWTLRQVAGQQRDARWSVAAPTGGSSYTGTVASWSFTGGVLTADSNASGVTASAWTLNAGLTLPGAQPFAAGSPTDPMLSIGPGSSNSGGNYAVNDYAEITITPQAGRPLTLTGLAFNCWRGYSGTNADIRAWGLRSSLDGYAADIVTGATSFPAAGTQLALVGSTILPQSVTFGAAFASLTAPVTFRLYVATPVKTRTIGFDDLTFTGTVAGSSSTAAVGTSSDLRWTVRATAGQQRDLRWTLRQVAGQQVDARWPVNTGAALVTVWRDDFTAGSPGSPAPLSAAWLYRTGTAVPGGPAGYGTGEHETNASDLAHVWQDGTALHIKATRDGGGNWTSGRVESTRADIAPKAGELVRVEARMTLPSVAVGAGYWPAFWLLGEGFRGSPGSWPGVGELDILESVNQSGVAYATMHAGINPGGPWNETTGVGATTTPVPSIHGNPHVYALEWDRTGPEVIRWYVDGALLLTQRAVDYPADYWQRATGHGYYVIINLAMGGSFPDGVYGAATPLGSTTPDGELVVDYVAVSSTSGTLAPASTTALFNDSFSGASFGGAWQVTGNPALSGGAATVGVRGYGDRLDTTAAYDLTGRSATVRTLALPASTSGEAYLQLAVDFDNLVAIGKSGPNLICRTKVAGVTSDSSLTWNASTMAYWRILVDGAGAVTWQTSGDGVTWTSRRTASTGVPALTAAHLSLLGGHWGADPDESATFDDVAIAALATGTTAVGSSTDLRWTVRARAGQQRDARWSVAARAGQQTDVRWTLRQLAGQQRDVRWTLAGAVGKAGDLRWSVAARAGQQRDLRWTILGRAGQQTDARWSLRAATGASSDLRWNLSAPPGTVGAQVAAQWTVRQVVADVLDVRWTLRSAAGRAGDLRWTILARAGQQRDLRWTLAGTVGRAADLRWLLRQLAGQQRDLRWALAARAGQQLDARWTVTAPPGTVGTQVDLRWTLLAAAGRASDLRWPLRVVVTRGCDARWALRQLAGVTLVADWATYTGAEHDITVTVGEPVIGWTAGPVSATADIAVGELADAASRASAATVNLREQVVDLIESRDRA